MNDGPSCSCCGVPALKYNQAGHDPECIWYDDEMYRLAGEWLGQGEYESAAWKMRHNWKSRYDLIVPFLLDQIKHLKGNQVAIED